MNTRIIKRKERVLQKLLEVFGILARCPNMNYMKGGKVVIKTSSGKSLLSVTETMIATPVTNITDRVFQQKSSLPDSFISTEDFTKLIDRLNPSVKGLDHVGFCYTVQSQAKELLDIEHALKDMHVYEMTSTDLAKWYFVGDRDNWKDPMIELLPALPNNTPDLPYWMPHVQIDMETNCSAAQISEMIRKIFGDTRKPQFQIDPGSGVYAVRLWLGTVSGVNIMLDIGTNIVDLRWVRVHMLYEKQAV